jgi:AcrR family transcriptional regulator/DNA-binding transcriptional regulator YdaS (Cro superfamily)
MQPATTAERVRTVIDASVDTQRQFAEAIGLDETKLSKALSGKRQFSAAELLTIADHAGVTVNWLVNGHDDAITVTAVPGGVAKTDSAGAESRGAAARRRILDTAWHLIAERGYHQVRTADIAEACGTSSATIHYHFPSKSELLDEALRHNVKLAFDRQVAELRSVTDPYARLLRLVELQLPKKGLLRQEWSIWLQVWTESAIDPERRELYWESYDRWHRSILMTIEDGAAAGVFHSGRSHLLTTQLTALIDGLGIQTLTGKPGASVAAMRTTLHDFVEKLILRPEVLAADENSTRHEAVAAETGRANGKGRQQT